ncbi:DUF4376 domain-containing protein [Pseudomonas bohemica]|uniref:DUF4376 domain-containing protein n=1 Tax=Pseudomonas bohemica TaxID=2044872 RepID=UPI000DA60273|nr:DUF4376 domain-containing protein [Pseudomonas bohemica]
MIDFSQAITKESKSAAVTEAVKVAIAARRYTAETAGITFNATSIDTGRDSQALITGAALSAMLDSTYVCNWKTSAGFVELDASTLVSVAQAVRAHVQSCFDREGELLTALEDGTYTDTMLEEGWPT